MNTVHVSMGTVALTSDNQSQCGSIPEHDRQSLQNNNTSLKKKKEHDQQGNNKGLVYFAKFFKILRHIESCGTCMEH